MLESVPGIGAGRLDGTDVWSATGRRTLDSWAGDQFERAWNTHDMNILGSITTEDVDFVNVAGLHWKGRTEVVKEHAERHKVRFKNSVWTTERVSVQFLASDITLVHVEWQTRGDLDFDLKPWPPRKGIFSWLVVKNAGSWRIRAAQNTGKD
ncbi:MAG: SgcJ/EcaC family oxidoreductase [Acidobacteria bacterium]|nr:SgcJ/EcaC family oxidoreductase [Acidobacteriota bacterium]